MKSAIHIFCIERLPLNLLSYNNLGITLSLQNSIRNIEFPDWQMPSPDLQLHNVALLDSRIVSWAIFMFCIPLMMSLSLTPPSAKLLSFNPEVIGPETPLAISRTELDVRVATIKLIRYSGNPVSSQRPVVSLLLD